MIEPIPFKTTRYRCPHCPRTASSKARMVDHIGRCWTNPEARACKTCAHYQAWTDEPEHCLAGVSLAGRPACPGCGGHGWAGTNAGAEKPCGPHVTPLHIGDGAEVKSGPIVGCDLWVSAPRCQEPDCPDFGSFDFGEGTCPAEHAEDRTQPSTAEEP